MERKDSTSWIWTALIISVLIVVSGCFFTRFEISKISKTKGLELEAIARLKTGQISSWLEDEKQDVRVMAQSVFLIEKIRQLVEKSFRPE